MNSFIKKTTLIEDDFDEMCKYIESNDKNLLSITIINPQPCKDFKVRYKQGSSYFDYIPWWKQLFKKNFIYNQNVYEYEYIDDECNLRCDLYEEDELRKQILDRTIYNPYQWHENHKYPVWRNYGFEFKWDNGYGNSCGIINYVYLHTQDINKVHEIYNKIYEKYLTNE